MKRFFCILLTFCFLCCGIVPGVAEDWTLFESRYGFTLWYPEDQMEFWIDDWYEETAEAFCPLEDESGVAEMVCRGSRFSVVIWDDYTRISDDDMDADLGYPFEVTAYTDGDVIVEQWIVSAADADYVFIIQYEQGDPQGWAPLFHSVLETLEFPSQPAVSDDFLLDFFQGGAAGMQFIDVVIDEEAEPISLVPYRDMNHFRLETLVWDDETFTVSEACPIYTADPLSPGDNLNIYVYFEDFFPNLRFSYTDADGKEYCWYLFESGRDGSLMLLTEDEI